MKRENPLRKIPQRPVTRRGFIGASAAFDLEARAQIKGYGAVVAFNDPQRNPAEAEPIEGTVQQQRQCRAAQSAF